MLDSVRLVFSGTSNWNNEVQMDGVQQYMCSKRLVDILNIKTHANLTVDGIN